MSMVNYSFLAKSIEGVIHASQLHVGTVLDISSIFFMTLRFPDTAYCCVLREHHCPNNSRSAYFLRHCRYVLSCFVAILTVSTLGLLFFRRKLSLQMKRELMRSVSCVLAFFTMAMIFTGELPFLLFVLHCCYYVCKRLPRKKCSSLLHKIYSRLNY